MMAAVIIFLKEVAWPFLKSRTGMIILLCAAVWVFYEGVPIAKHVRSIPWVGPVVAEHTDWLVRGRVSRAFDRGSQNERLAWQEKQRREFEQLKIERAAAQAKIDTIVTERLQDATQWALEKEALLQIMREEDADAKAEGGGCAACPAISKRMSRALDAIGR